MWSLRDANMQSDYVRLPRKGSIVESGEGIQPSVT